MMTIRTRARTMVAVGVCALLAAAGLTATVTAAARADAATTAATTPVKVMPLGDSLTGGPGCWRALLWSSLQAGGYTGVDFVGTLPGGGCNLAVWDGDNEGHGGYLAINTAAQNLLPGWLSATSPDMVMMTFGTNDVWNAKPTADIITAFSTLVDQMRANNPSMRILVAKIPPVAPSGCTYCQQGTIDLNAAIPGWAATKTTTQSPITVVDQWTGWDPVADTIDGVHQSDSGNQKMAAIWYTALTKALGATTPASPQTSAPSSSASASRSTSASASASASASQSASTGTAACSATYSVTNSWQGGFQGEVAVKAGSEGVSRWTVSWTLGSGQTITQAWNATLSTSGSSVTATGVGWNSALAPAASTTFGFLGTYTGTGSVPIPTVTCAAG